MLRRDQVVDDDSLHPGAVVWLGEPALQPDELARYDRPADRPVGPPAGTGRG